jgi:DNA invertase Pin-like site-specific DNA recombinase
MRVGYLRVSTGSEDQRRSAETQEARLWAAGCDRVLPDVDISGHREKGRKGSLFPELIELILGGQAEEVVVPNFDRTQRRMRWGMELLDALEIAGIKLLELDSNTWIDPKHNPTDVLMAQIRTAVQENESRVRSLKVKNAIAANRHRGRYTCGMLPFGYRYERPADDGVSGVIPDPERWPLAVRMLQQLVDLECNVSEWVRRHEAGTGRTWTTRGVRCWIGNPILRGVVMGIEGGCIPLIDPPLADRIDEMLARRAGRRGGAANRVYPFTGLVRCEGCGKNLHNTFDQGGSHTHRLKCLRVGCPYFGRGIREDVVRRHVIALVAAHRAERMAEAAIDESHEPPEAYRIRQLVSHLENAIATGGQLLEPALAQARRDLEVVLTPRGRGDVAEALELFSDLSTVGRASDEQLYVIFHALVEGITWHCGHDPAASLTVLLR